MKIIKDDKILDVTEKAYKVVYKDLGYKPWEEVEVEVDEVDSEEDEIDEGIESLDEITRDEIIEKLVEKGIEHNPRDKKEVLYNLMIEGE